MAKIVSFSNLRVAILIPLTIAALYQSQTARDLTAKLILSTLRVSMGQGGLTDLSLLSIEKAQTEKTDFGDLI